MSKADYYPSHLFISTLRHTVEDPPRSQPTTILANDPDPNNPPSVLPGLTKPIALSVSPSHTFHSHSASELPQPATSASPNPSDPRPNWLRAHLSGHQSNGRIERDAPPPPEHETDDGVDWIFESVEGSSANVKPGYANGTGSGAEREKLKSEIGLSKARKQAAEVAFLDQLKGEDRVLVDVSNLYIFFLRNGTPRLFSPSPSFTDARDDRNGHYGI